MNILLTGFNFTSLGGLEIVSAALARSLAEMGHDVRCAAIHGYGTVDAERYLVVGTLPSSRLLRAVVHRAAFLYPLESLRRQVAWADLIIACHCHTLPLVSRAAAALGRRPPVVAWLHGREVWGRMGRDHADELRRADKLVAVSHYTSDSVARLLGEAHRPVVVHNPIDVAFFRPGTATDVVRHTLLTVGRHDADTEHKGYGTLVDALAELRSTAADLPLRLRVAGEGSRIHALRARAAAHGLGDRVEFLGAVSKRALRDLYATSDVFAFPSRVVVEGDEVYGEGFGVVNIEAAACGRPVLTSTHGGCPETVVPGVTGLTVDPDSVAAVAAGIERLFRLGADERDAMGERGRRFVTDNFAAEVLAAKVAAVIGDVPRERRSTSGGHDRP
jgi:phosphatidylinositol alpha-1,6-mannosyltransferase